MDKMPRWPLPAFYHQWEPLFPSLLVFVSHSSAADSEKVRLHCMWFCFSWCTAASSCLLLPKSNIFVNKHLKFRTFLTCSNNYCKNALLACLSSLHPPGIWCLFFCFVVSDWSFKSVPLGSFPMEAPPTSLLSVLDKWAQLLFQPDPPAYLFSRVHFCTWSVQFSPKQYSSLPFAISSYRIVIYSDKWLLFV